MKLARTATLLTVGLMALALGGLGCSKKIQKPTTLMGPNAPITDDGGSKPIGSVPPVTTGGNPTFTGNQLPVGPTEGVVAAPNNFDNWREDRQTFKDQTVYFDFDKATVRPGEVNKLKEVARRMKSEFVGKALRIEGHCDERGTEEYNRTLGDRRAQSIREFLVKEGVSGDMMPTITYGEDRPADPGHNDAAFAKNRRGELILLTRP